MTSPFDGFEVDRRMRPSGNGLPFDLDEALASVVVLQARIPADGFTAASLGVNRLGNGIVIGPNGLVLTIGYLITEAEEVTLLTNDGRSVSAHALGYDQVTGLGLVNALEPLGLPVLPLGDSRRLVGDEEIILAGGGGRAHAVAARLVARAPFAGHWEYLLDEALFTAPGHPHWSGAALIGPTGALLGVGSLQMSQEADGGQHQPINMCVPIELLPPILDDLSRGRPPQDPRPWLGVFSQDSNVGVVVLNVTKGGPADRAEVRTGDVILAVDDQPVLGLADFYERLWARGPAGIVTKLRLRREGDTFDVEIRTADRAARLKKPRLN